MQRIASDEAHEFAPYVPSRYRERVRAGTLAPDLLLVGRRVLGVPAAAGLAIRRPGDPRAFVESLYVAPPFRDQGFGKALLGAVTDAVRADGAAELSVVLPDEARFAPVRAILHASGWDAPVATQRQLDADEGFRASPRLADPHDLSAYEMVGPGSLTARDLATIDAVSAQIPSGLDPLHDEAAIIEPATFFLRRDGEIVAWAGARAFAPDIALIATVWVSPTERGGGLGARLGALSIGAALDAGFARARFTVDIANTPMVRIIDRDVVPYGGTEVTLVQTTRRLGEAN